MTVEKTKAYIYADRVLKGQILACAFMIKACERFKADLKRKDVFYDLEQVEKVTQFFEEIIFIPELAEPRELPLPHAFWIQQLYGFRYKENGLRRFRSMLLEVARKNFKTFFAAGVSLYELILGNDSFPDIIQGANSRDQALFCSDQTGKIIKASPDLTEEMNEGIVKLFTNKQKTIGVHYSDGEREGRIQAIPKEIGDGGNVSCCVIDEFHEAESMDLIETIKSGQGQRKEPLNLVISSPGSNKNGPLFTILRKTGVDVLNGVIEDDRNLVLIFEQDEPEDWDNISLIEKANPMIPYSITLEDYVKERIRDAKKYGGRTEVNTKIKNCGIWTDAAEVWISDEIIKDNNGKVSDSDLLKQKCFVAFDLSKSKDLTNMTLFFPDIKGVKVCKSFYWIPEDKLDSNEDHVDYRKWTEADSKANLIVHDGDVIDHELVSEVALVEMKKYSIQGVSYDQKYAYAGVIVTVAKNGYLDLCTPVGQGFNLSPAVRSVETETSLRNMDFMNNPITRWCFANTVLVEGDQGHVFPSKKKSRNKIDGVSGLVTAYTNYSQAESAPAGSFKGVKAVQTMTD